MKKFFRILLVTVFLISLSAFLAPIVYQVLPQFKFEKILNRLLMISVLAVCFIFVRIDRNLLETFGFQQKFRWFRHWISGFSVSMSVLMVLVAVEYFLGAVRIDQNRIPGWSYVFLALLTGIVVGAIEEFFFRGFVFLKFKKLIGCIGSLILTNLIYSSAHFIKNGRPLIEGQPGFFDSLRVLGASFQEFGNWGGFWPGFVGLFIFGLVLSYSFKRSSALFLPMGIHAGAVTFLKMTNRLILPANDASLLIYGGKGFYSGILGWFFIGIIGWLVAFYFRSSPGKRC